MIRVFLAVIAMFFLPFFAYAAYAFVRDRGEVKDSLLQGAPVNWLLVAGTILAVSTLAKLVSTDILEYEGNQSAPAKTSHSTGGPTHLCPPPGNLHCPRSQKPTG